MEPFIAFLTEQLKSKGIRPSYQRMKVLEYLSRKGGHPTVDEIYRALSPNSLSLSKVTVYNTMHTFVETGVVRPIDINEAEMRYDITLNNHGHFLCEACGMIYNFQVNIDQVPFEGLGQFKIMQKNVYFKGLYPNCRKQITETKKG